MKVKLNYFIDSHIHIGKASYNSNKTVDAILNEVQGMLNKKELPRKKEKRVDRVLVMILDDKESVLEDGLKILEKETEFPEHYIKGIEYYKEGKYDQAGDAFEKALKTNE